MESSGGTDSPTQQPSLGAVDGDASSLYQHIHREKVWGANLDPPESAKNVIKPWHQRLSLEECTQSNVDDQLAITVPFTCPVRIKSIMINTSTGDFAPTRCRAFINRPDGIDFDELVNTQDSATGLLQTGKPQADFALLANDGGVVEYPVSVARFSNTNSITIVLSHSNSTTLSRFFYLGFRGTALVLNKEPGERLNIAAANAADRPVDGLKEKRGASQGLAGGSSRNNSPRYNVNHSDAAQQIARMASRSPRRSPRGILKYPPTAVDSDAAISRQTTLTRTPAQQSVEQTPGKRPLGTPHRTPATTSQTPATEKRRKNDGLLASAQRNKTPRKSAWGDLGTWANGREESPMDVLRRLARAPDFVAPPTPSEDSIAMPPPVAERTARDSIASAHSNRSSLAGRSSSSRATQLVPGESVPGDLTRESTTDMDQSTDSFSHSRSNVSIVLPEDMSRVSDLGVGRRKSGAGIAAGGIFATLADRHSRISTGSRVSFADPLSPDSRNFSNAGLDDSLSISALEAGSAPNTPRHDNRKSDRSTLSASELEVSDQPAYMDDELVVEEDEVSDELAVDEYDDENALARNAQFEDRSTLDAYNQDDVSADQSRLSEAVSFQVDDPYSEEEYDGKGLESMREMEEEEDEQDDDDAREASVQRLNLLDPKDLNALLKRRIVKKRKARTSPYTGEPVPPLPASIMRDLFSSFLSPNSGAPAGASLLTSGSRGSSKRVKLDSTVLDELDSACHDFFGQFAQNIHSQSRARTSRRSGTDTGSTITEADIVAVLKQQGHVTARHDASSLAHRLLPRELTDQMNLSRWAKAGTVQTTLENMLGTRKQRKQGPDDTTVELADETL